MISRDFPQFQNLPQFHTISHNLARCSLALDMPFLLIGGVLLATPRLVPLLRALAAAEARNLSAENLPVGEPTLSSANANAARVGTVEKRSRVDGASNLDATRLASRGVSRLIERERDGGSRDARGLTRRATRAFVALGFYRETFEPMFLESTAARYARRIASMSKA